MRTLIAIAGLCLLAVPRVAEACEPWPRVQSVLPEVGATLPANGIVVARGAHIDPLWFYAYVDGDWVETEVIERLSDPNGSTLALRPVEQPAVGSTLEIRDCGSSQSCEVLGTWTLGEADHEPPSPPIRVQYDYVAYTECSNSCEGQVDRRGHVRVEAPEDEPRHIAIGVRNTQRPSEAIHLGVIADLSEVTTMVLKDTMNPGALPEESVCVEVRVFDLAGNEAHSALETCAPCHVFTAPSIGCETEAPEWTDAELFAGGDCIGAPTEPLPPLPAPLDPDPRDDPTGSTGGTSDASTGGAESTTTGPDGASTSDDSTTSSPPPPATTTGLPDPSGDPSTGNEPSSSTSGGADAPATGGCRTTDSNPPPAWLLFGLAGLAITRRRS